MANRNWTVIAAFSLLFASWSLVVQAQRPVSKGRYRIPYEDGLLAHINRDHLNHPTTQNRIDMVTIQGLTVVAAANGWIREIEDSHSINCPGGGCENNYVWIEHTNGEWSKYSHILTDSTTNFGRFIDEFVTAGTELGYQNEVGIASGDHLHFEVAVPNNQNNPVNADGFLFDDGILDDLNGDGDDDINRQNRIPAFCGVNNGVVYAGYTLEAGPCLQECYDFQDVTGVLGTGDVRHIQANNQIFTESNHTIEAGGGEALTAGVRILLLPGFHAKNQSYFSASIAACNDPGV